jgi:hypothetical protein
MMKVQLKNCFLAEEHEHASPYLETYEWPDGSTSVLPACCMNSDLGISEFPNSIRRLIRVDTTNVKAQMVSGIYSAELLEVDKDLFFISSGDIDEPQIDAFFCRASTEEVFQEYLKIGEYLDIPVLEVFKALQNGLIDQDLLIHNWVPVKVFNNDNKSEGLEISIEMSNFNSRLYELIEEVVVNNSKINSWRNNMRVL